jgi:hypothetical protein
MSQNQSPAPTRHTRKARLIALAAAGMIAGSAGMAIAVTASQALPSAPIASPNNPPTCPQGYVLINNICELPNN